MFQVAGEQPGYSLLPAEMIGYLRSLLLDIAVVFV